ncbi:hypothetical protein QOT17_019399 [Balamuthia mandrillaris]
MDPDPFCRLPLLAKPLCRWSPFLAESDETWMVACSDANRTHVGFLATFSFSVPESNAAWVVDSMQEVISWMQGHLKLPESDICYDHLIFSEALNSLPKDTIRNIKELPPHSSVTNPQRDILPCDIERAFALAFYEPQLPRDVFSFLVKEHWFTEPLPSRWTAHSKANAGAEVKTMPLQLPLVFAVERWYRYDGSLAELEGKLTEEDLLALIYGFLHDQLATVRDNGKFYADFHPDNLFYLSMPFVFSHVGKWGSTLSSAKTTAEFPQCFYENLKRLLSFAMAEANGKCHAEAVIEKLQEAEANTRGGDRPAEEYFRGLLDTMTEAMHSRYSAYAMDRLRDRFGYRFKWDVIDFLISHPS